MRHNEVVLVVALDEEMDKNGYTMIDTAEEGSK